MYTYNIIRECIHEIKIVGTGEGLEAAELKCEELRKKEENVWASYYVKIKRDKYGNAY